MAEETIGDRLRRYRRLRSLSQRRLAELSSVSRQFIAELERNAVTIPREPENVRALAVVLGVTMKQLAGPTGWYDEDRLPGDPESAAIDAIERSDLPEDRKRTGVMVVRDLFARGKQASG